MTRSEEMAREHLMVVTALLSAVGIVWLVLFL